MNKKKLEAFKLRRKGYSYNEIHKILNIPKSTQSGWFKNLTLSKAAQKRLRSRIFEGTMRGLLHHNKTQTLLAIQRAKKIRKEAKKEINKFSTNKMRLIGAVLYWAEGYKRIYNGKTCHVVSFSNSDPRLIKIMMKFFRTICHVPEEKFRISLRIYPHMNEKQIKSFWSQLTHLSLSQFQKTSYAISRASKGKRPKDYLPYGTIQIRIYDTKLFYKIIGWIDGVCNNY